MNAALDLIRQAEAQGVRLEIEGGEVYASGTLSDDMVNRLRSHKGELLAHLTAQRHGIPLAELRALAGPDWTECERDPALLETLAHAVQTRRMREHGEIPPHYTSTTTCKHCGTVPIFEGCPDRVEGCPWCFNRAAGLPLPKAVH